MRNTENNYATMHNKDIYISTALSIAARSS